MEKVVFKIQVIVEPVEKGFHGYCPALKGLHTDGNTVEEAFDNAYDAAQAYIRSLIKHGDPIPVGILINDSHKKANQQHRKGNHQVRELLVASA